MLLQRNQRIATSLMQPRALIHQTMDAQQQTPSSPKQLPAVIAQHLAGICFVRPRDPRMMYLGQKGSRCS